MFFETVLQSHKVSTVRRKIRALFGMLRIKRNIYIIIQNKPTEESKRDKTPLKHDKVSFHPAATITT